MELLSVIVVLAALALFAFGFYETIWRTRPNCPHGCFNRKCLRCTTDDATGFPLASGDTVCKDSLDCMMCKDQHKTEEDASGTYMPPSRRLMNERIEHINVEIDRRNHMMVPTPDQKDPILL